MSYDAIVQCRFKSTRLQGKILLQLSEGFHSLDFLISNLKSIKQINRIILAAPKDETSFIFEKISKRHKVSFYSPICEPENVLKRFYLTSEKFKSKNIIRVTSDCPFVNINMIKKMILFHKTSKLSFLTNNKPRKIPHGFDCEIFTFKTLKKIYKNAKLKKQKEHVTMWFYENYFEKINNFEFFKKDYSKIRITLDYLKDYIFFLKNFKILTKLSISKKPEKILNNLFKKKKYVSR